MQYAFLRQQQVGLKAHRVNQSISEGICPFRASHGFGFCRPIFIFMVTILRSTCSSRYRVSSDILQLVVGLLWKKISLVEVPKREEDCRIPGWRPIPMVLVQWFIEDNH